MTGKDFSCTEVMKESLVVAAIETMNEESENFAASLEFSGEALDMQRFNIDYELMVRRVIREADEECTDKEDFRDRLFKKLSNNSSYLIFSSLTLAPVRALSEDELEACMPGNASDGGYTLVGYIEHVSPEIGNEKAKAIAKEAMDLIGEGVGQFLDDIRGPDALVLITNRMVSMVTRMAIDKTLYKYAITPIFDTVVDVPIQIGNSSN